MTEPLGELSIVALARDFGVTTTLIHYYVGSREDLVSGVINRYYQAVSRARPLAPGNWRANLQAHAHATFDGMRKYGGAVRYLMAHNRYRLFQHVQPGEADHGLAFLERTVEIFREGGFSAEQSALGYHLLMQFVLGSAYAEVNRQLPGTHRVYIRKRIGASPPAQFPAAHFFAKPFSTLDAKTAFDAGLAILLDGMQGWLKTPRRHAPPKASAASIKPTRGKAGTTKTNGQGASSALIVT